MEDAGYRGDSPMKKCVRLSFWDQCQQELGHRFDDPALKFLVLCSREAGDVSVLIGMGVEPQRIVAVDRDPEAIEEAMSKFPDAEYFVGDVTQAAHVYRGRCAVAFLDFCGPVSRKTLDVVRRVTHRAVIVEGLIGVGVMRGREKADGKSLMRGSQRDHDEACEAFKLEIAIRPNSQGKCPPDVDSRVAALWSGCYDWAASYGWKLSPKGGFTYHSRSPENAGVPMLYALAKKIVRTQPLIDEDGRLLGKPSYFVDVNPFPGQDETACLRANVLACAALQGVAKTALLFNLPPKTIIAWKAVASRRVA